jgi:hypothetical protein
VTDREDRPRVAPEIAAEQDAAAALVGSRHQHVRRSQQVSGVDELDLDALHDLDLFSVVRNLESRQRFGGVLFRVERERGLVLTEAALVRELRVFLLQVRRVGQHQPAEIERAAGAVHGALEALRHEARQPAAVIDMRVREDDGVDRLGGDRQRRPVAQAKLLQSLEQSAVEQDPLAVYFEEVLGARDSARSSEEGQ